MNDPHKPARYRARTVAALDWSPRFGALPDRFFTRLSPTPLPEPYLVAYNTAAADLAGIDPGAHVDDSLVECLAGNRVPPGATPWAAVYAGHQFGVYVPQLGDGRAISLGEVVGSAGVCEIQLKGAGRTPYSRMGDGRAVLRSSIREYLCSEAMHALGIPTTRALAIVGSDQPVIRETVETAAVVTRLAPSFVRFGSFEYWYHRRDAGSVRTLADFVIGEFLPHLEGDADRYPRFLAEVTRRTARLVAQWQAVGFMHGVMNTDNMSILGLTIDYGPYGFMEAFDPGHICNHSDEGGRYAYDMQPRVALWNLYALGQALVPLMEPDVAEAALAEFNPAFEAAHAAAFGAKLGLAETRAGDAELVSDLLDLMAASRTDFTLFFRRLAQVSSRDASRDAAVRDHMLDLPRTDAWLERYRLRLAAEGRDDALRRIDMNAVNPLYVLRNHLAEQAIRKAADERDFSEIARLAEVLSRPYDEQPGRAAYAEPAPEWARGLMVSCSS